MKPKIKIFLCMAAASVSLSVATAIPSFAYTVTKAGQTVQYGGKTYYYNGIAGVGAYSTYKAAKFGNRAEIRQSMITDMPAITINSEGNTGNAAFRFMGFGGAAQYETKLAAMESHKRNKNSGTEDYQWLNPPFDVGGDTKVSFRRAGIGLNNTTRIFDNTPVSAMTITNPAFPSDSIHEYNSGEPARHAALYGSAGNIKGTQTGWGYMSDIVPFGYMYINGLRKGVGEYISKPYEETANIRENRATNINRNADLVKRSFELWAERDEYGAGYKEAAEGVCSKYGVTWYEYLNYFFRIDGNVDDDVQSVTFYTVFQWDRNGKAVYRTYSIPTPTKNNVSPTMLVVRDDQGKELGYARRDPSVVNAYGGLEEPTGEDSLVHLERGKTYTVSSILSFYGQSNGESTKFTDRSVRFTTMDSTLSGTRVELTMNPSSEFETAGLWEYTDKINPDKKSSGAITTSVGPITSTDTGETTYYHGDAAFINMSFELNSDLLAKIPTAGTLVVEVPEAYSTYGDNDYLMDDQITINYVIGDPTIPPPTGTITTSYGDMNIGRREYRRLHWFEEKEVPDPDKEPEKDPVTGVETIPMKTVYYEYVSNYGWHGDSSSAIPEGKELREVDEPTHEINGKSEFKAGSVNGFPAWWEYGQQWSNAAEDLNWKVWMERNNKWQEDNIYVRSETVNEPFNLGFYISRSRGEEDANSIEQPTLDVDIYGISPETGDDGKLIANLSGMKLITDGLKTYEFKKNYLQNIMIAKRFNGADDYPRIKVVAKIADKHGESGIYGSPKKSPYNNGWQTEHDTVERIFYAKEDDMRIMEVELRDSEGVVVYHADRYSSEDMDVKVSGHFDREEDLTMKVVIEQCLSSGHNVKDPTIDVLVEGLTEDNRSVRQYVNSSPSHEGEELGDGVQTTFDHIVFRPGNVQKLSFSVQINERHNSSNWRENIWDENEDAYADTISCTTADLALRQDIELYNSKHNLQDYLTFAEYLSFKFDIRHIGSTARQTMVVGNSQINPLAKVNTKIYNADQLTYDPATFRLIYKMASDDPKANKAILTTQDIQAKTRLFPGLGLNGYASHVQAWIKNYIVQTWKTPTGNVAAYGHILVSGIIDPLHDSNYTNIRDNTVDYVQKEFKGEKDFKIEDISATAQNSISDETGVSVQIAVSNLASSFNDQTVVDKTYLDIYIDDELKTYTVIEVPTGDTVVTEVVIPHVNLKDCKTIEARVNTGKHQTHYEYVLRETNTLLHEDPFINNYATTIVCPNKPDETICPECILSEDDPGPQVPSIFGDDGRG